MVGIADHGNVDTCLILSLENILDGHLAAAVPFWFVRLLGGNEMGMPINDHRFMLRELRTALSMLIQKGFEGRLVKLMSAHAQTSTLG